MSSGRGGRGGYGGGSDSPRKQGGHGGGSPSRGRGGGPGRGGPSRGRGRDSDGPPGPARRDLRHFEPRFSSDLKPRDGENPIRGISEYITRPGYVKKFTKAIRLVTNHYKLTFRDTSTVVYHYDVEISGIRMPTAQGQPARERKLNRAQSRKVFNALYQREKEQGGLFDAMDGVILPVFDGNKNMYAVQPLNEIGTDRDAVAERTVRIENDECTEGYSDHTVKIKVAGDDVETETEITWSSINDYYNGNLDQFPLQAISVLNTVLRSGPIRRRFEVGANSMYTVDCDRYYLGRGIEYAFGNFQSVRPIAAGLSIVMDRTATAFFQNLSAKEFIEKLIQRGDRQSSIQELLRPGNDRMRDEVNSELQKLHFYTTHLGRKKIYKKFNELSTAPADRLTFESPSGRISVANYFRNEYNIVLEYPQLPCMDFGTDERHAYIPLELCTLVENQHIRGLLRAEQNSQLIRATATEPRQRFLEIQEFTHAIKSESRDYLQEFNINMDETPIRAWGKVIPPPVLVYGRGKTVDPVEGKWDLRGIAVKQGIRIQKWVAFYVYDRYAPNEQDFHRFLSSLQEMGRKMGIEMGEPAVIEILTFRDAGTWLKQVMNSENPQLVLFVQPKNDLFRARVKHLCEVTIRDPGIFSQCILEDVYRRANPQVQANILLKINAKCGGVNHTLQTKPAPLARPNGVIVIGADVTHSAPANVLEKSLTASSGGERFDASIAAVVGTTDSEYFKYHTEVKVQKKERQEMISQLGTMMEAIIRSYYVSNQNKLPQTVIFYRDGVSEGQFKAVLESEVTQMEQAFKRISAIVKQQYRPKVTFIVVQKRHHTRVRAQNPEDGIGRMKNVPPGTVVDTNITHPRDLDWFMASHEGIQGLSRPTHYYVLRDDCKLTVDELTEMTYHLCHTYAKATRSVSIPSPVFYAHLAAYRARDHISTYSPPAGAPRIPRRENESDEEREQRFQQCVNMLNSRVQVAPRLKKYMYYC